MPFDAEPAVETTTRDRMIRLRDFLAALPSEQFSMRDWGSHECGTPACIGGWAERMIFGRVSPDRDDSDVGAALGLDMDEARDLFCPVNGRLRDGQKAWHATPFDAVRVLDHYLETGKIDWSVA